jgi:radical SAM superfamily enzyme YgiQ (UPF0313 family)
MKTKHRESGAIKKEWGGKLPVLLVYPDTYRAGMSNLAVHTLYSILNSMDNVVCERCFWRKGQKSPVSIESSRQITDFSVIAFSISFETDYINAVDFLRASSIELYASQRMHGPIIMAGGIAVTLNPEPIADFMDVCVIGEAEGLAEDIMDVIHKSLTTRRGMAFILKELDNLEGVYVPSFYRVRYGADGRLEGIEHEFKKGKKIRRHISSLSNSVSSTVIYTDDTTFSDMHLQEVSRGCRYRCRFCISGYAYLPPRHRKLEDLKNDLLSLPTGVKKVGIISPMVTEYPHLNELLDHIHALGLKASMSSMRADSLALLDINNVEMSTDQFSAAIAPEAGTYRLRRVLNKQLSDEQILQAARFLGEHNINILKLYFLIGIPGETYDDVKAIAELSLQIKEALKAGKGRVSISINPLIPKPFTPFQWLGVIKPDELRNKLNIVTRTLKSSGIKIEWEKHYLIQAILSRGDRRLSEFLVYLSKTDKSMNHALQESGIDIEYYALREREHNELLPWDFIDYGFKKDFLLNEYRLGMKGVVTPVCKPDTCTLCGICG